MRVVILLQDGLPVEVVALPDNLTREHEVTQFAGKIEQDRAGILIGAYAYLHPSVDKNKIGACEIPELTTTVLPVKKETPSVSNESLCPRCKHTYGCHFITSGCVVDGCWCKNFFE